MIFYMHVLSIAMFLFFVALLTYFIVIRFKILNYIYDKNNGKDLSDMGVDSNKSSRYIDWQGLKNYAKNTNDEYLLRRLKRFMVLQMGTADLFVIWLLFRVLLIWVEK